MGIGFQIKSALRDRGMTLRQLANEAGISCNTLYAVTKRDSKRMDCVLLYKISVALDLPVSYFTNSVEMKEPNAVKVVRCKDCKHWHEETGWCYHHSHFIGANGEACHPWESNDWKMLDGNDFCSYGERRADG